MNEMTKIAAQPEYSEAARKALAREPRLFINGEWVRSTHGETIPVYDPSTGREIAAVVDASIEDVDRAVAAARPPSTTAAGRPFALPARALIHRLADLIEAHIPKLASWNRSTTASRVPRAKAMTSLAASRRSATCRLGDQDFRRAYRPSGYPAGTLHAYVRPRADRSLPQIVPVEFPADDGGAEDRARARRRLHASS
jgi:phenylacetaldehyde dehydrogenase